MNAYPFALVASLVTLVIMAELLRRRRLREKYAVLWLALGAAVLFVSIVPGPLFAAAELLGFRAPVNLVFLIAAAVLLIVSVQLSAEISTLEEENRSLAEDVGVLRLRVERLEAATGSRPELPPDTGPVILPGAGPGRAG